MPLHQDELSRRRRLYQGLCPTHGTPLVLTRNACLKNGIPFDPVASCSKSNCQYFVEVSPASKLWSAIWTLLTTPKERQKR